MTHEQTITDPLEAISKWLPAQTTSILANSHTLRMLVLRHPHAIDLELDKEVTDSGVFGYIWNRTLFASDDLPDGAFVYLVDDKHMGRVEIGGTNHSQTRNPAGIPFYHFVP